MATDLAVFPIWKKDWIQGYGTEQRPIIVSCLQGNRKLQIGDKVKISYHRGLDFALPVGTVLQAPEYCLVAEVNTNKKKSGGVYLRLLNFLITAGWVAITSVRDLRLVKSYFAIV